MECFKRLLPPKTIIPVVVIDDPQRAAGVAEALLAGGARAIEVTLRTANALAAVERIAADVPEICLGAGTITAADDFKRAADAGAQFLVSPGLTPALAAAAHDIDLPYLPGVATVSEIIAARELGFSLLKFFPAELLGGVRALGQFASLFPKAEFCPTGGVNDGNVADYLAEPNVSYTAGGWLAPREAIAAADWPTIIRLTRAAFARPAELPAN